MLYSFYHPEASDLPDVLTLVEAVRAKLHPDDQTKLTYTGDEFHGLRIAFTDVDKTPLTLYAEPREAAKLATEGIRRAGDHPPTEQELAQRYLDGKMTTDPVFKNASPTQKPLLGQLAAVSTYEALDNALYPHESTMLMPMTGGGGMQSTHPMPGVMSRVAKLELRQEQNGLIHADVRYEGRHVFEARYVVSDAHIHCVGLNAVVLPREVSSEEMLLKRSFNDFA